MRDVRVRLLAVVFLCGVLFPPVLEAAEWSADLLAGGAFTETDDATLRALGAKADLDGVENDDSLVIGVRATRWLGAGAHWGVGVEGSRLRPDLSPQLVTLSVKALSLEQTVPLTGADITFVPVLAEGMYRTGLMRSAKHPQGLLQPYAGLGLGFLRTSFKGTLVRQSGDDTAFAWKLEGGLRVQVAERFALVGEGRYVRSKAKYDFVIPDGAAVVDPSLPGNPASLELRGHFLQVASGVSFRF